jgi:hypothetical protein
MEFKMKLYEILDTKMDIEYEIDSNTFKAKTIIDENVYIYVCDLKTLKQSNFMNFGLSHQKNKPNELGKLEQHIKHVWEISFSVLDHNNHHQYDLTNANVPLKVFSFIKQALLKFVNQYHPKYITFTADSNSRKNVYSKLISKSIKIKNKHVFNNGYVDVIIMKI